MRDKDIESQLEDLFSDAAVPPSQPDGAREATAGGRPAGRPYEVSRPYGMSTGRALVGHCIGGLWARCGAWDAGG